MRVAERSGSIATHATVSAGLKAASPPALQTSLNLKTYRRRDFRRADSGLKRPRSHRLPRRKDRKASLCRLLCPVLGQQHCL